MIGDKFIFDGATYTAGGICRENHQLGWLKEGWDVAYFVDKGDAFWCAKAVAPDGQVEWVVPYRNDEYECLKPPRWIRELQDGS